MEPGDPKPPPFQKHDADKLRFDLLPPEAVKEVVKVLTHGARKYAPGNWINAPSWSRYYAALERHLNAWWGGESLDPETGISHLAHAACSLLFLMELERMGRSVDDRPKHLEVPGPPISPPQPLVPR